MTDSQTLCSQVEDRLSTYLDGELSPLELVGTESHLEECTSCRAVLASLSEISNVLQAEGSQVPAPPPWSAVEVRLGARHRRLSSSNPARLAFLAASLLFLAGAGWLLVVRDSPVDGRREVESNRPLSVEQLDSARPPIQMAGFGLPGLDQFLAQHQAVEMPPPEIQRQRLLFDARIPDQLPGGFQIERAYLIKDRCCAGVCFIFKDGEDRRVGLVQQPPSHPFEWQNARLVRQQIGDTSARRASLPQIELTQIDPDGRNVTLVVTPGFQAAKELVRYLSEH